MPILNLDLSHVEASENLSEKIILPQGNYNFEIISTEFTPKYENPQEKLLLTYKVLSGEFTGSTVSEKFDIYGPRGRKSQARLKKAIKEAGYSNPDYINNSDELIGLKFSADVDIKFYSMNNTEYNTFSNYSKAKKEAQTMDDVPF